MIGRPDAGDGPDGIAAARVPFSAGLAAVSEGLPAGLLALCCCAPHPINDSNAKAATAHPRAMIETMSAFLVILPSPKRGQYPKSGPRLITWPFSLLPTRHPRG